MKHPILLLIFCSLIGSSFSQDISGSWGGIFYAPYKNITFPYFFNLDIQQKGKTVWGVYSTCDSNIVGKYSCLSSVSATLSKKPGSMFDLYKEKIEDYDKKNMTYEVCNFVNRLAVHYFIEGNDEYMTGQWFSEADHGPSVDGSGGYFVLHRQSSQLTRSIDQYFPKLEKMVEKGKTDQPVFLKADELKYATPNEKKLMNVIKTALGRNLP